MRHAVQGDAVGAFEVPGARRRVDGFAATLDGSAVVIYAVPSGKHDAMGVHVAAPGLPLIQFRRESGVDRFGRRLWLNREVQTGDAVFDAEVYIETDERAETVREFLAAPALRDAIRAAVLRSDGVWTGRKGVNAAAFGSASRPVTFDKVHALLALVAPVAAAARPAPDAVGEPRRARGDLLAPAMTWAFIAGLGLLAVLLVVRPDGYGPYLTRDATRLRRIVHAAWLATALASVLWMRGHSRSLRNIAVFNFFAGFGFPWLLPIVLGIANALLDKSPPVVRGSTVLETFSRRSSDGRSTAYLVRYTGLTDSRDWGTYALRFDTWRRLHPGDLLRIVIRRGALGWTWLESIHGPVAPADTPSQVDVAATLAALRPQVRACTGGRPEVAQVEVTFANTGRVLSSVVAAPYAGTDAAACITRTVASVTLPRFGRATYAVSFSFVAP
jgi:hypothetical protein